MASLIHDDIIDKSDNRRGNNTVNYIHGNHAAVLAGDYIFAKAFAVLSSHKLLREMEYLVEAIQEMCDGEVKQADEYFDTDLTVEKYFNRIGKKTAVLLSSCCKAGAAASGSGNAYIDAMGEYGTNVGYAFQIIDDVLDFTGDEKKLGKPRGIDLMQGNVTLPVILLMEDSHYGEWIKSIIRKKNITKKEFYDISQLLSSSGAIKKSYDIAGKCAAKAKSSIYSIPDSPYRAILLNLAEKVVSRDH
jgi:heptaprenyl diphosphate synthase